MNIAILTLDAFNELDSFQRVLANVERYIAERDKKVLIPAYPSFYRRSHGGPRCVDELS